MELKKIVTQYQKDLTAYVSILSFLSPRNLVEQCRLRRDIRAALLASKQMIDADNVSNRDELLRSSALQEKPSAMTTACVYSSHIRKHADCEDSDDALMKANNNVTDALRRTMTLMQGELEKSVLSTQMLGMFPTPLMFTKF
jgi:hypothetical protein